MKVAKPKNKPQPRFSSGPTAKPATWKPSWINESILGRSHRSKDGLKLLQQAIDEARKLLCIPKDHHLVITPGSATGALETAFWNLLGPNIVDVITCDTFGDRWVKDIRDNLKLTVRVLGAPCFGEPAAWHMAEPTNDIVYVHNATTSGVIMPNCDWILDSREGLVICDATSAAFGCQLDWSKLDATAFSWQKVLGGEAGFGMLVLSPRAIKRLESYTPTWPLPLLYQLRGQNKLDLLCKGYTINTVSLMCVSDFLRSLKWFDKIGGVAGAAKKTSSNYEELRKWVEKSDWCDFVVTDPQYRSPLSVVLKITTTEFVNMKEQQQRQIIQKMVDLLEKEKAAYDIRNHIHLPPSLRIWCGPTVEHKDVKLLTEWLDWAWQSN